MRYAYRRELQRDAADPFKISIFGNNMNELIKCSLNPPLTPRFGISNTVADTRFQFGLTA